MGDVSSIFAIAGKVSHWTRKLSEISNLKSNSTIKNISAKSDETVLQNNSATRRSLASNIIGITTILSLSVAHPPFAAAAAIGIWQLAVSLVNFCRVKRELRIRVERDASFDKLYYRNDYFVQDVTVGCTMRAICTVLSTAMVGVDHMEHWYGTVAVYIVALAVSHIVGDVAAGAIPVQGLAGEDSRLRAQSKKAHEAPNPSARLTDTNGHTFPGGVRTGTILGILEDILDRGVSKVEEFARL